MKRLYVVGMGPGEPSKMTMEAMDIIKECPVIAGYTVYIDLLKQFVSEKEWIVTGMMKEVERCELALQSANEGKDTAMVCSGDSGVYGMAGIVLELAVKYPEVEIIVVPGVTAALSGAALLGAPLGHDFAIISLSDLLTPWELIERRLLAASMADLAICIYNPSSKKRADYLQKACEIIRKNQPDNLVCGYVRNIGRDGEEKRILSLLELKEAKVDMFTTVFIGNSQTKEINGKMVTPRGYRMN